MIPAIVDMRKSKTCSKVVILAFAMFVLGSVFDQASLYCVGVNLEMCDPSYVFHFRRAALAMKIIAVLLLLFAMLKY